jgi:hypothetical protein
MRFERMVHNQYMEALRASMLQGSGSVRRDFIVCKILGQRHCPSCQVYIQHMQHRSNFSPRPAEEAGNANASFRSPETRDARPKAAIRRLDNRTDCLSILCTSQQRL